jgi:uncharacterized protein YbjT (DUF2867 family)
MTTPVPPPPLAAQKPSASKALAGGLAASLLLPAEAGRREEAGWHEHCLSNDALTSGISSPWGRPLLAAHFFVSPGVEDAPKC